MNMDFRFKTPLLHVLSHVPRYRHHLGRGWLIGGIASSYAIENKT
jgi:hypothetical protein